MTPAEIEAEPVDPTAELYDPEAWDRWASEMQRITDFHAAAGRFGKAEYCRHFVGRYREAAARLRRFGACA